MDDEDDLDYYANNPEMMGDATLARDQAAFADEFPDEFDTADGKSEEDEIGDDLMDDLMDEDDVQQDDDVEHTETNAALLHELQNEVDSLVPFSKRIHNTDEDNNHRSGRARHIGFEAELPENAFPSFDIDPQSSLMGSNGFRVFLTSVRYHQWTEIVDHVYQWLQSVDTPSDVMRRCYPPYAKNARLKDVFDNYSAKMDALALHGRNYLRNANQQWDSDDTIGSVMELIEVTLQRITYAYNGRRAMNNLSESFAQSYVAEVSAVDWNNLRASELASISSVQRGLMLVYMHTTEMGLRIRDSRLYKPILLEDGTFVHTYEKLYERNHKSELEHFVASLAPTSMTGFCSFLREGSTITNIAHQLSIGAHDALPELHPSRHQFAVRNGAFDILTGDWYPSHDLVPEDMMCGKFFDVEMDYESMEDYLQAPFIPQEGGVDWLDMPNESVFSEIINYQITDDPNDKLGYDPNATEIKRYFWVGVGRLLFDVNELDKFDRMLQIYGESGSGKSTFAEVLFEAFPEDRRVCLTNNVQANFYAHAIPEAWFIMMDEMVGKNGRLNIPEQDILQFSSGGWITTTAKNQNSRQVRVTAPAVIAGNTFLPYSHELAAHARRMFAFWFKKKIKNPSQNLEERALSELPYIIMKAATAYRKFLTYAEGRMIHLLWPPYFDRIIVDFTHGGNPLVQWMHSRLDVIYNGPLVVCPYGAFVDSFHEFMSQHQMRDWKWDETEFLSFISEYPVYFLTQPQRPGEVVKVSHKKSDACSYFGVWNNKSYTDVWLVNLIPNNQLRIMDEPDDITPIEAEDMDDVLVDVFTKVVPTVGDTMHRIEYSKFDQLCRLIHSYGQAADELDSDGFDILRSLNEHKNRFLGIRNL